MRLSIARASAGGHTPGDAADQDDTGFDVHGAAWRRMALALAAASILGCVGILFGSRQARRRRHHRLRVGAGLRLGGQLRRQRLRPGLGQPARHRSTTGTKSPTRPAAPSTRRATST